MPSTTTALPDPSATSPGAGMPAFGPPSRALYRFAVAVVIATLVLIKAGAMVTSTGSGLAFDDWPLANGSWWPPDMKLEGMFEHGHRAIGTAIGLLVLGLAIWLWLAERRRWLCWLGLGLLGLVSLQGVIGGTGVLWGLPAFTSVTHGVLAQVIVCLLVLVAFALSPAWAVRHVVDEQQVRAARRLAAVGLSLVFCQLVAGAILRHTNGQGMLWLHIFNAILVALFIMIAALYCGTRFERHGFRATTRWVLVLLIVQLILGFVTLGVRRVKDPSNIEYLGRSIVATSHVVVGALLFLCSALLFYRTLRNLEPAPAR